MNTKVHNATKTPNSIFVLISMFRSCVIIGIAQDSNPVHSKEIPHMTNVDLELTNTVGFVGKCILCAYITMSAILEL